MIAHVNRSAAMFHENIKAMEYAALCYKVKPLNHNLNPSIVKNARMKYEKIKSNMKGASQELFSNHREMNSKVGKDKSHLNRKISASFVSDSDFDSKSCIAPSKIKENNKSNILVKSFISENMH